jgi:hypothetical protein
MLRGQRCPVKPGMTEAGMTSAQIIFISLQGNKRTNMNEKFPCETCPMRAKYDQNPKSLVGRFWRWHINFCPGFRAYFTHQDEEKQKEIREKYNFQKYQK